MIEYNGVGNFDNPTIYIEIFQNLVKSGKYEMIFIFKDENEVMYYNHACFTEIKICHDNCEKCDVIPDDVTGHPTKLQIVYLIFILLVMLNQKIVI